jgi:periplasmic copper chaperone A
MSSSPFRLLVAIALLVGSTALAADFEAGALKIEQPWSRATPPAGRVGAGYLNVVNRGAAPDRLVSASSPAAGRVEIHEMRMDGNVMRMRELPSGLPVAAGETVALKPGGFHLMLMELRAPLKQGSKVPMTLVFERAGKVEIELSVESAGARDAGPKHTH